MLLQNLALKDTHIVKANKTAGTPVSGPKHEENHPRLDYELDALHLKVRGWSVNETHRYLERPWWRLVDVIILIIITLVALYLPVYLKAGEWVVGVGLVVGIILIFAVVRIMNSHFRRADKYDKFYQIKWVCDSERISKLAIASRLLGLAKKICDLEVGLKVLENSKYHGCDWVKNFLHDKLIFERDHLSEYLDHLIMAMEYEFGLLVDRSKVFHVLWFGCDPERIEFVPKTFELPTASK